MATVRLVTDEEASPDVRSVFEDIRTTRKSDFVNNFWRALAVDPANLRRTWDEVKAVMAGPGPLDPLTRELVYIAVSATRGCSYCVHSHTAAARSKGMSDAHLADLMAVLALAGRTNQLAETMQVPVDPEFIVSCI